MYTIRKNEITITIKLYISQRKTKNQPSLYKHIQIDFQTLFPNIYMAYTIVYIIEIIYII